MAVARGLDKDALALAADALARDPESVEAARLHAAIARRIAPPRRLSHAGGRPLVGGARPGPARALLAPAPALKQPDAKQRQQHPDDAFATGRPTKSFGAPAARASVPAARVPGAGPAEPAPALHVQLGRGALAGPRAGDGDLLRSTSCRSRALTSV